jgi:hypothetical protein
MVSPVYLCGTKVFDMMPSAVVFALIELLHVLIDILPAILLGG